MINFLQDDMAIVLLCVSGHRKSWVRSILLAGKILFKGGGGNLMVNRGNDTTRKKHLSLFHSCAWHICLRLVLKDSLDNKWFEKNPIYKLISSMLNTIALSRENKIRLTLDLGRGEDTFKETNRDF